MHTGGVAGKLAVIVNGGMALYLLLQWAMLARNGEFWKADFTAYYTGYAMILRGDGARLYDLDEQKRYQHALFGDAATGLQLPWIFPPVVGVPACVLALLPPGAAFHVWTAIQLGLLGVLVWMLARLLATPSSPAPLPRSGREGGDNAAGRLTPGEAVFYLAALLAFPPLFITFQMGQMALVLAVCLAGFALAVRQDHDLSQASWVVLGLVKPQLIFMPGVILLARVRWRPLVWAVALFAIWAAAATLVLGPQCWVDWVKVLPLAAAQTGDTGVHPAKMHNFKAILVGLLGVDRLHLINVLTAAALGIASAGAAALWWRRPASHADFAVRLGLCLQLGLIFTPYVNSYDPLAYCVPLTLFLTSVADRPWLNVVVACCPLVFLIDHSRGQHWPLGFKPFLLLMAVVAVLMARRLARGQPPTAIDSASPVDRSRITNVGTATR